MFPIKKESEWIPNNKHKTSGDNSWHCHSVIFRGTTLPDNMNHKKKLFNCKVRATIQFHHDCLCFQSKRNQNEYQTTKTKPQETIRDITALWSLSEQLFRIPCAIRKQNFSIAKCMRRYGSIMIDYVSSQKGISMNTKKQNRTSGDNSWHYHSVIFRWTTLPDNMNHQKKTFQLQSACNDTIPSWWLMVPIQKESEWIPNNKDKTSGDNSWHYHSLIFRWTTLPDNMCHQTKINLL